MRRILAVIAALTLAACTPAGPGNRVAGARPAAPGVAAPWSAGAGAHVVLPGTVEASEEPLYANTAGRIQSIAVATGGHVHAGEIVATVALPEIDAQYAEAERATVDARAAVVTANAQMMLRRSRLKQSGWICAQDAAHDPKLARALAPLNASLADLKVAQVRAAVAETRLKELQAYREFGNVRAPFDAVVTRRLVEPDTSVRPATERGARPVVIVTRTDTMRTTVEVPATVTAGAPATFDVAALPGQHFAGQVTRVAAERRWLARGLRAEVEIANADGALRPGMSGTLTIDVPR